MGLLAVWAGIYLGALAVWLGLGPLQRRLIDDASRRIARALGDAGMTLVKPPLAWEAHTTLRGVAIRIVTPMPVVSPGQMLRDSEDQSSEVVARVYFPASGPNFACAAKGKVEKHLGDVTSPHWPTMGHEGFDARYEFRAEQPLELSWWILDALVRLDLCWMQGYAGEVTIAFKSLPVEVTPVVCDLAARWPGASPTPASDGPLAPPWDDLGIPFTHVRAPLEMALFLTLGAFFLGVFVPMIPAAQPALSELACGDASLFTRDRHDDDGTSMTFHCGNGRAASYGWLFTATGFVCSGVMVCFGMLGSLTFAVFARRPQRPRG